MKSDSEAIYFDAFLPSSKRPTRLDRVQKSTIQLIRLFSKCPYGLPIQIESPKALDRTALFDVSGQPAQQKHFPLQPPFLVPSIIDALKASDKYRDLVQLVPGEADEYCARHAFKATPACILTSDSDLLVHDLPEGTGVVFLRDIYTADDNALSCALFTQSEISAQFEVSCTRLAYERERLPQATLNQLRRICLEETPDDILFRRFCQQYVQTEEGSRKMPLSSQYLDPRLSEVVYQLSDRSGPQPDMFLPMLTDSPLRTSAWEPSLDLRAMGYSLAAQACKSRHKTLREHRKIQNITERNEHHKVRNISQHKGTSVELSVHTAKAFMTQLTSLLKSCADSKRRENEPAWLLACLAVDIQDQMKIEKRSWSLVMLQNPEKPSKKSKLHSWDITHVTAHFLATLYSFRLVDQILRALPAGALKELQPGLQDLKEHISSIVPPLADFPTVASIAELFQDAKLVATLRNRLDEILGLADDEAEGSDESVEQAPAKKKQKTGPATSGGHKTNNIFDLLAEEQ
jgi:hypothetical protein